MPRQRSLEFRRRFREATAGKTQMEIADALGVSQGTVSNMAAGYPPSKEIIDRFIDRYGVNRNDWYTLAGFTDEDPDVRRMAEVARMAAEETFKRLSKSPEDRIRDASQELTWEPDLDTWSINGFPGIEALSAADREVVERWMRAKLSELRQRQGRE